MRIIFLIIIFLIISSVVFATVTPRTRVEPKDFVILPWGNLWTTNNDYDEIFKEMYDMGFNVTTFVNADKMDYVKKYHLKALLQDEKLLDYNIADYNERYDAWAKALSEEIGEENLPYIYQVYVRDEPAAKEEVAKDLTAKSNAIRKYFHCEPYINLFPNYASEAQLGVKSYDDYLDFYVKNFNLKYVSYDHYAFSVGRPPKVEGMPYNEGEAGFNENIFYNNLNQARNCAIRNNIGFINIIQSVGALHWPTPNDYIISIQGWSTLAYGGKGLSYFTLYTPNMGNWHDAPYDEYGFKSPTWRYVAHMNYAIHNISPIYTKLKSVNVYHIGNVPVGCNDETSAKLVKELNLSPVNGELNVLVGEFTDSEGKNYAIIVNKNPKYSIAIDSIKFNKGTQIKKVEERSYGNLIKNFGGEDIHIMPGHGVLLFAE